MGTGFQPNFISGANEYLPLVTRGKMSGFSISTPKSVELRSFGDESFGRMFRSLKCKSVYSGEEDR